MNTLPWDVEEWLCPAALCCPVESMIERRKRQHNNKDFREINSMVITFNTLMGFTEMTGEGGGGGGGGEVVIATHARFYSGTLLI